jgi:hypothetical protein
MFGREKPSLRSLPARIASLTVTAFCTLADMTYGC